LFQVELEEKPKRKKKASLSTKYSPLIFRGPLVKKEK